ncbi:beta-lactamase family protein [Streptomyces sp. NBC_00536]|uniref:serine hydrolase domain-containing protein n=1 Tax=Streptomyces sp. NBC_00536 TaxID=2975769 RepID=UPI002E80A556|nr:serine hydrolase domain-containing protein [Streptomyces sp. NBC_00536]WUC82664.1 beta-lactamase family protein [Streptomyces sp. NBC_00536]
MSPTPPTPQTDQPNETTERPARATAELRAAAEAAAGPAATWAIGDRHGTLAGSGQGDAPVEADGLGPVLALWPVIGTLVAEGALSLHTPLAAYSDEATGGATAHHLLTHAADHGSCATLGGIAEHLTGRPLADLAATRVWHPLGMVRTALTGSGRLHSTVEDLSRFLRHLLAGPDQPLTRAWITESLRIRTGELTPARGLLWHPAPGTDRRQDTWTHHGPGGADLWVSPLRGRWALLLAPTADAPARGAFRAAAFG